MCAISLPYLKYKGLFSEISLLRMTVIIILTIKALSNVYEYRHKPFKKNLYKEYFKTLKRTS